MNGLHLTKAGEGGLQHAIPGGPGGRIVKGKRQLVELVRLINHHCRLINKLVR